MDMARLAGLFAAREGAGICFGRGDNTCSGDDDDGDGDGDDNDGRDSIDGCLGLLSPSKLHSKHADNASRKHHVWAVGGGRWVGQLGVAVVIKKDGKTVRKTVPDEADGECNDPSPDASDCPPAQSNPKDFKSQPPAKSRPKDQEPQNSVNNQPS
ncbi:GD10681 [Drosophila simulans]|uniref:GD10681 n=1 Tax=Drosophila simulans TaxID=7240 RepID=B4QHQ6_DROSI|nr:GD10681 [Drosophila simulans]